MLISWKSNFLFIHIPKNAGTSIRSILNPLSIVPEELIINKIINLPFSISQKYWHIHTHKRFLLLNTSRGIKLGSISCDSLHHAKACDIEKVIGKELFADLFKFCFVRNPWAREVSEFEYIKRDRLHPVRQILSRQNFSFSQYLNWKLETKSNQSPQLQFIADADNNLLVDFIGKVENLDEDCRKIANIVHLDTTKIIQLNSTNYSCSYRDYYDYFSKKIIEELYQDELNLFDYSF
jgi:hypothetical protein